MTAPITLREKLEAIAEVAAFRPLLAGLIVLLSIAVGALEGVGLGFILPIVSLLQRGSGADPGGPVGLFVEVYGSLGLPFTLEYVVVGVGLVVGVRYGTEFVVEWLIAVLEATYLGELRTRSFEQAIAADAAYFDERGTDEVVNAIITQTRHASHTITGFVGILRLGVLCLAYAAIALVIAPRLMLVTALVLGGLLYGSRSAFESGYDVGDRIAAANERIQEASHRALLGITEVRQFALASELTSEFARAVETHTRATVRQRRNRSAIGNLNQFGAAVVVFGLIYLGVSVSSLSLPSLGVFLFAMFRLAPRLSNLNGLLYAVDNDLPHLVRAQRFLERLDARREPGGERPAPNPLERIAFEDVGFSYPGSDGRALADVSFTLERGEYVAFVGPSGAGKSTITALLAGEYRPDRGRILANAMPIDAFEPSSWRSRLSIVRQDPFIFNETLEYNLTVGNRAASADALQTVCEVAQVTEFLDELPNGLETVLGEDGVRLSGGQRQRIAIARALLKDADVLVLDEATSELDSHLEAKVQSGIEEMDREFAILAIAHRLSTVTGADRIHVVEGGEIVESGTHDSLADGDGPYSAMIATQGALEVG